MVQSRTVGAFFETDWIENRKKLEDKHIEKDFEGTKKQLEKI